MSGIKSLADELRESIKSGKAAPQKPAAKRPGAAKPEQRNDAATDKLLSAMQDYELSGQEKLLIRLDERSVFLMKQLKIAKGIDMNKLIAFSLQNFFDRHPHLIQYIKDNIKSIEL